MGLVRTESKPCLEIRAPVRMVGATRHSSPIRVTLFGMFARSGNLIKQRKTLSTLNVFRTISRFMPVLFLAVLLRVMSPDNPSCGMW